MNSWNEDEVQIDYDYECIQELKAYEQEENGIEEWKMNRAD